MSPASSSATPAGGQRLLFSATLDNGVDKLVKRFLQNEVLHSVDEANSPVAAMTHHVFTMTDADSKKDVVRTLASGTGRRILFMRTKHHAKKLAQQLTAQGIPSVDLHGNLSQPARDRNLAAFSSGAAKVLVATDVAARGVHVDDVELVIHVDPPTEHKAYLHRSGRTARAGAEGAVVTLVLPGQERDVADLLRKAAITVKPVRVTPQSAEVTALVGEVAAYVTPAPEARGHPRRRPEPGRQRPAQARRPRRAHRRSTGQQRQQPRSDRSGRPAQAHRARMPRPRRRPRRAATRTTPVRRQPGRPAPRARAARAAPRTPVARGKLMVGSVVRQNGGNRRAGR